MPNKVINIRATDCAPQAEEKYVEWYEDVHVPMLLEIPEVKRVTRYMRVGDDASHPKYLSVYEFEDRAAADRYTNSKEVAESQADVRQTWPDGEWKHVWKVQYEVTKVWER
jgi:hypothetical protein